MKAPIKSYLAETEKPPFLVSRRCKGNCGDAALACLLISSGLKWLGPIVKTPSGMEFINGACPPQEIKERIYDPPWSCCSSRNSRHWRPATRENSGSQDPVEIQNLPPGNQLAQIQGKI
ncbi:hypothetical protein PUN28_003678 [Cardiocondyla obscurior]|uniref:Uncharacterized protein n=1 Tax=Cardiocondyla obscurior TaxID=286306 RepID=A0AAW2GMY3_9HYME